MTQIVCEVCKQVELTPEPVLQKANLILKDYRARFGTECRICCINSTCLAEIIKYYDSRYEEAYESLGITPTVYMFYPDE